MEPGNNNKMGDVPTGQTEAKKVQQQNKLSSDDKLWGMLSHLLTFSGAVIPFGNFIAPLVIMLTQKDKSDYIVYHAKEALNMQIAYFVYGIGAGVLCFILVGILLIPVLSIAYIVFIIIAAIKANDGERYKYPFIFRILN